MARNSILAVCAAGAAMVMSGCGSSSANVVTVSVTPSAVTVVAGQVQNFTATVGGSTTLTVAWTCTYVFTPLPTTTVPNPVQTKAAPCTSGATVNGGSIGTWTTSSSNGSNVLTYTAPSLSNFPNPIPIISFVATADADHKKTGTGQVGLDSGIRVSITPPTATVPVGIVPAQTATFAASFQNSPPLSAQFRLVQPNTASTNTLDQSPNPLSDSCDPTCGTIDNNGVFTAPSTVPTDTKPAGSKSTVPTTVFVVVSSSSDPTHFAVGTITLVNATTNPVSFSGLYPPTIAAGGVLQDVFLKASNLLNTVKIIFISPVSEANLANGTQTPLSNSTQVFTIPISAAYCTPSASGVTPVVNCDASIMTRVRLLSPQLLQAEPDPTQPAWIMITNLPPPAQTPPPPPPADCAYFPGSTTSIACKLHIVNASPAVVAAAPDSFQQGTQNGSIAVALDGGYYGASSNAVNVTFAGTGVTKSVQSGARRIIFSQDNFQLPSPGLYEATVSGNTTQGAPPTFPTATTNIAVQPNFANFNPNPSPPNPAQTCIDPATSSPLANTFPGCVALGTGGNLAPSAIALNSVKGYAVITDQASNQLEYIDLTGATPTVQPLSPASGTTPAPLAPTDVAIDGNPTGDDLAIVVSSGHSTLALYSINQASRTFTSIARVPVDLQTLLGQPTATGLPTPFSFGVDPTTHLGVVVYPNTNVAFIVDVNPNLDSLDKHTCFLPGKLPPCVLAPVSVNTGPTPKVIMQPNVPLAYVTPGGGNGATSVVNLLQQGKSAQIAPFVSGGTSGAVRTAGTTKIITLTAHGINPILGGTVIISGINGTKTGSSFNGTFQVAQVIDPFSFTYSQALENDDIESNTSTNSSGAGLGTVQYGTPYFSFSTSTTVSGAAINPITHTFGYADYNASSSQIGFISTLDQTLTTLSLTAGSCNGCTPNPAGAPEIGFRSVAFDPFTNVLVAYNPSENSGSNFAGNEISLINPGGPAPVGSANSPSRIIAAINTGQTGTGSYTPSGQTAAVAVYGPMAYDPKTKFVLVANAGSNTLTYMNLDPGNTFQKVHIQDLQLQDATPPYGVPVVQPPLDSSHPAKAPTSCSLTDPTQPCMPQAVRMGQSAKLRILGHGFMSGSTPVVRLDGNTSITPAGQTTSVPIPAPTSVTDGEIDVTIPAEFLFAPHDYALDVQITTSGGTSTTNAIDLHVLGLLDMQQTNGCTTTTAFPQGPEGVAIDESRHIALVTNYACNSVSVITIDPNGFAKSGGGIAPYGTIIGSVAVGKNPIGIGVISRLGYAVVANSGDTPNGTASIIDISNPESPQIVPITTTSGTTTTTANSVTVGLSPLGVTIDQDRALALVSNNGSNTLSSIDLTVLAPSVTGGHTQTGPLATTVALSGPPTAIAVDPNRAAAVVTSLLNSGTTSVTGGLDVVNLATTPPLRSSTASVSSLPASLTGVVFDPGDPNGVTGQTGIFYATSTQANSIFSFNPDTGGVQTIRVGINPFSVGYNYQTGTLLTINSTSNSSSVVDVQNFKMRQTLGISSLSQFAIAVDNLTNTAVIVDQNNNRVVFLNLPK